MSLNLMLKSGRKGCYKPPFANIAAYTEEPEAIFFYFFTLQMKIYSHDNSAAESRFRFSKMFWFFFNVFCNLLHVLSNLSPH